MVYRVVIILILFIYDAQTDNESNDDKTCKKIAHYFRKQVEEIEDTTTETADENDPRSNLVQFLIQNVKEIFDDLGERPETTTKTVKVTNKSTTIALSVIDKDTNQSSILDFTESNNSNFLKHNHYVMMLNENSSLATLIDKKRHDTYSEQFRNTERIELMHLSKDVKYFGDTDDAKRATNEVGLKVFPDKVNNTSPSDSADTLRSCIACNNVFLEDCNDPKNKLIPSVVCNHEDDLCYSLHTPFGIVDRGCFNVNRNLTTYVCSCNLCNYIPISGMPYIFSNKQDWVDNVIELSRTRRLRKSVLKDMSCLRCEVNTTNKVGDMLDSANCLEGNIGNLAIEECDEDEVCAVKAVRSDGYIWRGCSKMPLYNYWWAFCNNDLCNYDTIISIYDFVKD